MSGSDYKESTKKSLLPAGPHFFHSSQFSKITKRLFKRFRAEEYQELEDDLRQYGLEEKQVENFFLAEGYPILDWVIAMASDAKPLAFLCKIVDKKTLQSVFLSRDLEILKNFLLTEAGFERGGVKNYEKTRQSQIEKFRLMLSIDCRAVKAFMEAKISARARCITKNMEANFKEALASTPEPLKQKESFTPF